MWKNSKIYVGRLNFFSARRQSTINVYFPISDETIDGYDNVSISNKINKSNLLFTAYEKARLQKPRYESTWELTKVMDYIRQNMGTNEQLSTPNFCAI